MWLDVPTKYKFSQDRQYWSTHIVQNFFNSNKKYENHKSDCSIFGLFKSPRDSSQFVHLARQVFSHNSRFAVEAYKVATEQPYSYLLLDLRNEQDELLRLRSNVFPGERQVVFVPI